MTRGGRCLVTIINNMNTFFRLNSSCEAERSCSTAFQKRLKRVAVCYNTVNQAGNGLPAINKPRKMFVTCHMCQGTGRIEQVMGKMPSSSRLLPDDCSVVTLFERSVNSNASGEPVKLPPLVYPSDNKPGMEKFEIESHSEKEESLILPSVPSTHKQKRSSLPATLRNCQSPVSSSQTPDTNSVQHQTSAGEGTVAQDEDILSSDIDLLPPPKPFDCPQDALKTAIGLIRQTNWNQAVQGIQDIVQVARFEPNLLEPSMPLVNRTLCSLLRSLRSHVVRTACQAAKEIFRTMQCTQRPDFDEIVACLLHKTADMNRFIRQDANEALDAMVTFIPTIHSVRALVEKGAGHKNPLVRSATARLLTCIAVLAGPDVILGPYGNKDTRRRMLATMAQLMADGNLTTRQFAKQLCRTLMSHEDFDTLLNQEVSRPMISRIEKIMGVLRHQEETEMK